MSIMHGVKGSVIAAGVGGVAGVAKGYLIQNSQFVAKRWWAPGLVVAVAGHFVRRKSDIGGLAMAAAGGLIAAQDYFAAHPKQGSNQQAVNPDGTPVQQGQGQQAGGFGMGNAAGLFGMGNAAGAPPHMVNVFTAVPRAA